MANCKSCNASGDRLGVLVEGECINCLETGKRKETFVSAELPRTQDEIFKMIVNKLVDVHNPHISR